MELNKLLKILKEEHNIDLSKVDDNKEIISNLISVNEPEFSKDLVLAKLSEKDEVYIRKMFESSEMIKRIQERIINKLEEKIKQIKETDVFTNRTKKELIKKLKYYIEQIKEIKNSSKLMMNEAIRIIPLLKRNKPDNTLITLIAQKVRDEEMEQEQLKQESKISQIIDNIKENKGL